MPAETLNCPMCGAAASSDATKCEHCGSRLATVACPSCFGMIFQGAKFCSHCGTAVIRNEISTDSPAPCPRCKTNMAAVTLGNTTVRECSTCEGLWVGKDSLDRIYADREQQAAILGTAGVLPPPDNQLEAVRYLACPICKQLMNRVNFAHCSHVIVDVCRAHGTWFDKDELRRIIEFIRAGGLEKSRKMEIEELEYQRRLLQSERETAQIDHSVNYGSGSDLCSSRHAGWDIAVSVAGTLLRHLLR